MRKIYEVQSSTECKKNKPKDTVSLNPGRSFNTSDRLARVLREVQESEGEFEQNEELNQKQLEKKARDFQIELVDVYIQLRLAGDRATICESLFEPLPTTFTALEQWMSEATIICEKAKEVLPELLATQQTMLRKEKERERELLELSRKIEINIKRSKDVPLGSYEYLEIVTEGVELIRKADQLIPYDFTPFLRETLKRVERSIFHIELSVHGRRDLRYSMDEERRSLLRQLSRR